MNILTQTLAYESSSESLPAEFWVAYFVFCVLAYAFGSWAFSTVFAKMGVEKWKAWVPIYNSVILMKKGDQNPLWLLLMFVPFASIVTVVFLVMAVHKINEDFGKDVGYTVLYVFLPFVWCLLLGLGSAKYKGGRARRPLAAY